jgi:hypothetical protein
MPTPSPRRDESASIDESPSVPRTPRPRPKDLDDRGAAQPADHDPGPGTETPRDRRDSYSGGRTGNT